jgi:tRNA U38,U39,U40 pseudouridine synthase TruA
MLNKYQANTVQNRRTILNCLNINIANSNNYSDNFFLGILTKNQTHILNQLIKVNKPNRTISSIILHRVNKAIYEQIWISRCQTISNNQHPSRDTTNNSNSICIQEITDRSITSRTDNIVQQKIEEWAKAFIGQNTSPKYIAQIIV